MKSRKPKTVKTPKISRESRFVRPVLLLLLILILPVPGLRQNANAVPASKKLKPTDPYALIFGTVWGPDDRPVYGIKVTIRQVPKKKPEWELYSNHAGEFAQRVAAGRADYVVGADLKGVKTTDGHPLHLAQEVNVHIDYDERVDIGLHLAQ